ncbi:MAG: carbohydrate kinase family protein [Pseudomonadota bacterium]
MRILLLGSIAYDNIMVFEGRFREHILPDQIHMLNVAFLVPALRREFGGCAANIAYNLRLLGGEPLIMATVGEDAESYYRRLDSLGIARTHVREVPGTYTAQAFITTDLDDNQITAFHPGAMGHSHLNSVASAGDVGLAIVSPVGREGMLQHARELKEQNIPFIFDPGQGLHMFSGPELLEFVKLASYVAVNSYEGKLLEGRTGLSIGELAERVKAFIVTHGSAGSEIHTNGRRLKIPCVKADNIVDPTGCGDAYRAGLLYGIAEGMDWRSTGQLAALMGALKIGARGGQNHRATRAEIEVLYRQHFNAQFG